MMDFLEFINTAEAEDLRKLTGMTSTLLDRVLKVRPFAALEDLLKLKGMSDKKLETLRKSYETPPEDKAIEPAPEIEPFLEKIVEPVEESVAQSEKPKRKGMWGKVIAWFLILLLLGAAVFAAIKWGLPYIYEKYVKPVESNAAEITDLASQQSAEVTRLNEELASLKTNITTLEERADAVDLSLQAHDTSLARLEEMQALLEDQLGTQKTDLLAEISNQIALTRAVDLVSRSRLYLSESNFGLAKTDLETSRNLLFSLLDVLPTDQVDGLKLVISRIDMALENLPAYPVVAVYDVDTAWQLLIDGLPNIPEQAVTPLVLPSTPTPGATATLEPTAAP